MSLSLTSRLALVFVAGCAARDHRASPHADEPNAAPALTLTPMPMSPVGVAWESAEQLTPTRIRLRARFVRRVATLRPFHFQLLLPDGVVPVDAEAISGVLPENHDPDEALLPFDLELTRGVPRGDVILVASIDGRSFGYHARVPYRFGRSPPVATGLPRAEPVVLGDRELGRPVLLGTRAEPLRPLE